MELRNKKTGEVKDIQKVICEGVLTHAEYSLAELNEEWEDYEEPKGYYYVSTIGLIKYDDTPFCAIHKDRKAIGNYFETREEAEKAVEKLKAVKRLKEARFHFKDYYYELEDNDALITYKLVSKADGFAYEDFTDDLELLFGGEE